MNLMIFAIRDQKTDQFANPMFLITKAHAIRSFADAINEKDANNQLRKHPEDFEMFHLGEYNTNTGEIIPTRPTSVATATELFVKEQ